MAVPVGFEGAEHLIQGNETCSDLPAARNETQTVSCWRLSEEELEEVNRTGVVWLSILSHTIYPQLVSGKALITINGRPSKAEPYIKPAKRANNETL